MIKCIIALLILLGSSDLFATPNLQLFQSCAGVASGYINNPEKDGTVLFHKKGDVFVIEKCGNSAAKASGKKKACKLIQVGSSEKLCSLEKVRTKTFDIVNSVLENTAMTAVTGGASNINKINQLRQLATKISLENGCLGVALMKNLTDPKKPGSLDDILNSFYEIQIGAAMLTSVRTIANSKSINKRFGFMANKLAKVLGERSRFSKHPRYHYFEKRGANHTVYSDPAHNQQFCSLFEPGGASSKAIN